jgi:soluble lytic murein transglycosylase-like protein
MKPNKLPPKASQKPFASILKSKAFDIFKYSTYVVLALAILSGMIYLDVPKQPVVVQKSTQETEIFLLSKTASIIARDGAIPLELAKKYALWIYEAAAKYSLDPVLLLSVMYTESGFNYKAVSASGPIGLFQIAASQHKDKTTYVALFDPHNNIMVGAQIIREYADRSKNMVETLLRYSGTLGEPPDYANKVLNTKKRYDNEIMKAMAL